VSGIKPQKETPIEMRLKSSYTGVLFCAVLALTGLSGLTLTAWAQAPVHKIAEPFESVGWRNSDDSTAEGAVKLSADVPPELRPVSKGALDFEAFFSGKGFEYFRGAPVQPFVIPGVTKSVSVWVRNRTKYGWVMQFQDGWGRSEVEGKKLEWNLTPGAAQTDWKKVTFQIPADWVQPVRISSVFTHNWESQRDKAVGRLSLDQLEVETDISGVDEVTGILKSWKPAPAPAAPPAGQAAAPTKAPLTPLLTVTLTGAQLHNVFSGTKPQFLLTAQNWHAAPAVGTLQWSVLDPQGKKLQSGSQNLRVEDNLALSLPLETPKYGVYRLDSTLVWADGKKTVSSQSYAVIPVARELTETDKDASPYGLNVLSARQSMVSTFRKAGIVWFRDYGFNYEWMVRARGDDNRYAGWPWYPKIVRDYESNGARVLANFQTSIRPPASSGSTPGPDRAWTKEIVGMLMAFPSLRAFELDNEYDLKNANAKAEEGIGWKNYGLYHKKFGDVARILGDGQFTTVENGRAGIWPERLRKMVQSGDFANIDVVNSHHYAGPEPPETNVVNFNMGFEGDEKPMTLFDQLRAAKAAGSSDGKPRQHWLTEFGWDTKAGPVVSPAEQAAYLARAYMLLAAAGTSKGFWYWDLDSEKANQFFDGCGLFTYEQQPKLAYAAYAGLTQILPKPEYIGTIHAGANTWGYLFRNEGKLVASLWTLDGKPGPKVDFGAAKLYDAFANPLPAGTVTLGLEPVYAVGVSEDSRWFHQAAYHLETPNLVSVTAGDTVTARLQVKNTRSAPLTGKVHLALPSGWTGAAGATEISVPPGKTADFPLTFRVGPAETIGEKTVGVVIEEGEPLDTLPLRVLTQRPLEMTVSALKGEPGSGEVTIRLRNRSSRPLEGTVAFKLPSAWSTATPEMKIEALKPMEVRTVHARVHWTATWKEGESASVEYRSTDGRSVQQPLAPGRLTIPRAPDLVMDGSLKDWPAATRIPAWALGSTFGDANAAVYLAWSPKGLYVAVDVRDSKAIAPDPRSFWAGDVLELFVDTRDKKTSRQYEPGDHQFWLTPQVDRKRAYVGQWKRGSELAETRYDLAGVQSAVIRKENGYVLECFLPAALLAGFKPTAGTRLGLNLNLSVKGVKQDREVFWSLPKSEGVDQPANWATVLLGN
jgi:hypothetical protein